MDAIAQRHVARWGAAGRMNIDADVGAYNMDVSAEVRFLLCVVAFLLR